MSPSPPLLDSIVLNATKYGNRNRNRIVKSEEWRAKRSKLHVSFN